MSSENSFPIWKEEYSKMGVSPQELYMRQNGLCYLKPVTVDNKVTIFCTDGREEAETAKMLNPTIECIQCIMRFTESSINFEIAKNEK